MKIFLVLAIMCGGLLTAQVEAADKADKEAQKAAKKAAKAEAKQAKNKGMLHHVVAFKFKADASQEQIDKVVAAFAELPKKIPQISKFQAGLNNSPEGLNKGFNHGWIISFKSEADREVYLKHPDHLAFVGVLKPILEDVFVIDFWGQK